MVDSGYMEAGGRGFGQPAGGGVLSVGPQGTVYHQSGPLKLQLIPDAVSRTGE